MARMNPRRSRRALPRRAHNGRFVSSGRRQNAGRPQPEKTTKVAKSAAQKAAAAASAAERAAKRVEQQMADLLKHGAPASVRKAQPAKPKAKAAKSKAAKSKAAKPQGSSNGKDPKRVRAGKQAARTRKLKKYMGGLDPREQSALQAVYRLKPDGSIDLRNVPGMRRKGENLSNLQRLLDDAKERGLLDVRQNAMPSWLNWQNGLIFAGSTVGISMATGFVRAKVGQAKPDSFLGKMKPGTVEWVMPLVLGAGGLGLGHYGVLQREQGVSIMAGAIATLAVRSMNESIAKSKLLGGAFRKMHNLVGDTTFGVEPAKGEEPKAGVYFDGPTSGMYLDGPTGRYIYPQGRGMGRYVPSNVADRVGVIQARIAQAPAVGSQNGRKVVAATRDSARQIVNAGLGSVIRENGDVVFVQSHLPAPDAGELAWGEAPQPLLETQVSSGMYGKGLYS